MIGRRLLIALATGVVFISSVDATAGCLPAQTRSVHLTGSRLLFWFDSTDDAALIDAGCPSIKIDIVSGPAVDFQPLHRAILDARDHLKSHTAVPVGDVVALAEVDGDYKPTRRIFVRSIRLVSVYALMDGELKPLLSNPAPPR